MYKMKATFELILTLDGNKTWYKVDKRGYGRTIDSNVVWRIWPECDKCDRILIEVVVQNKELDAKLEPPSKHKWVKFDYVPGMDILIKDGVVLDIDKEVLWYFFGKCPLTEFPVNVYVRVVEKEKIKKSEDWVVGDMND